MGESGTPLLLLVVPLLGAIVAALSAKESWLARASAMAAMLVVLALSLRIFLAYEPAADASRFDFNLPWMPALGINLHFAVDGFNVYLVLLAALLFPAVLGCTWDSPHTPRRLYLVLMLVLESSLLGTFLSQNAVLFFVFWEAVLIPAGVLILVYGGERRRRAAITFFLYTMAGSVLLLAAVIALGVEALRQTGTWSFELGVLYGLRLDWNMQMFVFIAIMLACLVKVPLVPFHAWLPLAYYEAPASVTALMAGALSKMGAYGILKLALPLAPDVAVAAGPAMAALAVTSLLYGAVLALREEDYKKLIAYSSLSHMGYVVLGLFSLREVAIHGALLQMLSHGVAVAGLFALLGMLEQRLGPSYRHATALVDRRTTVCHLVDAVRADDGRAPAHERLHRRVPHPVRRFCARARRVAGARRYAAVDRRTSGHDRHGARGDLHAALCARDPLRHRRRRASHRRPAAG